MAKTRYATKKRDYLYLNDLRMLEDTVTLMDQVEDLMAEPTKEKAGDMYEGAIGLWFNEQRSNGSLASHMSARLRKIADRYYEDLE